jgi:GAF domain-containing protein
MKNPLLGGTRSEVALPLTILDENGDKKTIGVLDVHSNEQRAFREEDIAVLQILADQMASAIAHLRLVIDYQQNLQELGKVYSRYKQDAWTLFVKNQQLAGYELTASGLLPVYRAATHADEQEETDEKATYSLPVRLRDETVATLEVWQTGGELSVAEIHLLEEFSERLSMALESARLYEEAQSRATREQQVTQIANQIRSSANIDAIMRNAVRELGLAFKANRTFIQLVSARKGQESETIASQSSDLDSTEAEDAAP